MQRALRACARGGFLHLPTMSTPMDMTITKMLAGALDQATPALEIKGIHKNFENFSALRDIDLTVRQGEMLCFLGPSGCGKTTLLRIIAGLETQTSGSIVQSGRDISWLPASERDYGIVFQSYALFPNLTIAENVAYGLVNGRMRKAEIQARVAELLAMAGLPTAGGKYPSQLSGGQQQRVALARALATNPGLLLLDEPLSALDATVRVRLRAEIRRLQKQVGITTIMVTHDQEEALSMSDRIVVMNHGVIEQVGTPMEIYERPASPRSTCCAARRWAASAFAWASWRSSARPARGASGSARTCPCTCGPRTAWPSTWRPAPPTAWACW